MEKCPSAAVWRVLLVLCMSFISQGLLVTGTSLGGDIIVDTNLTLNGTPYTVSQDLVVAENATLTIQPGVQLHFHGGVALRVEGSLRAKGNSRDRVVFTKMQRNSSGYLDDLNSTIPHHSGIRLHNGNNYRVGRLEIFLNGKWGTVCHDGWQMEDAQVACRQLGFLGAKRYYTHGGGSGPIWLSNVDCRGTTHETISLLQCRHGGIGRHSCNHREDIGLECESLVKFVLWKGIEFSGSNNNSIVEYVDISQAYEAISGRGVLPSLDHVRIESSVYGVRSVNSSFQLNMRNSKVSNSRFTGIHVKGGLTSVTLENSVVEKTTLGHGMFYDGNAPDAVDFCSYNANNNTAFFPLVFQAFGKAYSAVDCAKVIRAKPGQHLAVHYQSISGAYFELHVYDGNSTNATKLMLLTQSTGVNQAVTPSSSSGHELYIRFRFSGGSSDTRIKFIVTGDRDCCSLRISRCAFSDNQGNGFSLANFVGKMKISWTSVLRNRGDGITVYRFYGKLEISDTHMINNSANGLRMSYSSIKSCTVHRLFSKTNAQNGLYFWHVALKGNVSDTIFSGNAYHGIAMAYGAGDVEFWNVSFALNKKCGVRFSDGKVSTDFKYCDFSRNSQDGAYISNEAGSHQILNCTATLNSRYGISLCDPSSDISQQKHYFKTFSLTGCLISENTQFGVRLALETHTSSVNITINKNHVTLNRGGGIILAPNHNRWYFDKPRRVTAHLVNNHFEQNKVNTIYVYCTGFLGLDAFIESNLFVNNTENVIKLFDDYNCGSYRSNPVRVKINRNTFTKNRVESAISIDQYSYPELRSAKLTNNTFEGNEPYVKDLFPEFFKRLTTRAIIVFREGNFTLRENIFENPAFAYEISALLRDHHRIIDAKFNWWGSPDECKIVERMFDFQHRVELSQVDFYPFLLSSEKRAVSSNTSRPTCFLRGSSIGGIVDRQITLSTDNSPYHVRDDIIILTNGTLVVPKNVTIMFPSRSAMVVRGTLLVNGTQSEKVRFTKKIHQGAFRLGGGAGPWEGRLEFLVNGTWWPMCLPYGRSFTSEAKIICQQLDLTYYSYSLIYPSGNEPGFLHNVVCDENMDNDIMNCSTKTWSYGSSCVGYIVDVFCRQYNWAGLHLTMTLYQNVLHHLEISDAGFAYRSDIQIPGAALKVDFHHHNVHISNLFINNSMGSGMEVVYQSPFHYTSLMPHSTISNTKSHGVLSRSPTLIVTDIKMTRNSGNGFEFKSTASSWENICKFTAKMASQDMSKVFRVCSLNETFLPAGKVFHFTLETLEESLQLRCHHIMKTELGHRIVIQELYKSSQWYESNIYLNVHNGMNASQRFPWKMGLSSWDNQPIFNSSNSSIIFDFYKRAGIGGVINFFVFTVKEREQPGCMGGEIRIARTMITSSLQGGVLIGGTVLKYLSIVDTEVFASKEFGISLGPIGIEVIKITSTNLSQNKQGIVIQHLTSEELTIQNCVVNSSLLHGVHISIEGRSHGDNDVITMVNSTITASGDRGLMIYDSADVFNPDLLLTGNTFSLNKKGAMNYYFSSYHHGHPPTIKTKFNFFFRNQGPTVEISINRNIDQGFVFTNNTFSENQGFAVFLLKSMSSRYGRRSTLIIQGNLFLANRCPANGVINIGRRASRDSFEIDKNNFTRNEGPCVFLEGAASYVQISLQNNLFNENRCADRNVIEVLRLDEQLTLENNIFTGNEAQGVVLLQVVYDIYPSIQRKKVVFNNNTIFNNIPPSSAELSSASGRCTFVLSGILLYKKMEFHFNRFNNSRYTRELCVNVPAVSPYDVINVTHNWWGTTNFSDILDKIWDFYDNYDVAITKIWPILLSGDASTLIPIGDGEFTPHGRYLAGRLTESLILKLSQSPYFITSDLFVTENVTLIVEAGVMVRVNPGKSILVAGTLKVHGTFLKPVTFAIKKPADLNSNSQLPVRLMDGSFPWEGRAEVFYNNTWKPIAAPKIIKVNNISDILCKQLGYGPPLLTIWKPDVSHQNTTELFLVEFHCQGNETALDECSGNQAAINNTIILQEIKCHGVPWGNLRFVSPRESNNSKSQSVLNHVHFFHCGNRLGVSVPAIEAVISTPKLQFVTIKNCTSGGLRIYSPVNDIYLNHSTFYNTGGSGVNVVQTRNNIVMENCESSRNHRGFSVEEPNAENIPRVYHGRVFLCDINKAVMITNISLLYFHVTRPKNALVSVTCQKVLTVAEGRGMKLTLLYAKGRTYIRVYSSATTSNLIIDSSHAGLSALIHKELFIPHSVVLLEWVGDVNSEVVISVENMNIADGPCTFEVGLCGWQTFINMSINGNNATTTWGRATYRWPLYLKDYSYLSYLGRFLYVSNRYRAHVPSVRAIMISPPINNLFRVCYAVFVYRLSIPEGTGLSLYLETAKSPAINQKLIWRTKSIYVPNWRRVVIDLPLDGINDYRLLLEAHYNKSSYYSRYYVAVDDIELRSCSHKGEHRIFNSGFRGNTHESLNYNSVSDGSNRRPLFTIERCEIIDTPISSSKAPHRSAISIDIQNNRFTVANNFVAGNRQGAIKVSLGGSDESSLLKSLIYGNTFSANANGTLTVKGRKDTHNFVHIIYNAFDCNLGHGSTLKLSNVQSEVMNNFFYNNTGLYSIEYDFSSAQSNQQKCELNTLFLNSGLGKNYGLTIMSNGPMKYHRNNMKNPQNHYDLRSTLNAASERIDATYNWWGVGIDPSVGWRVFDNEDDYRLVSIAYKPFAKLPPRNILSVGCPANWLKVGSTCYIIRRGSRRLKEAKDYCEYYGGQVASISIPDEVEFINIAITTIAPDGKFPVPVWVSTEDDLEERNRSGSLNGERCTVLTHHRVQKVVPCDSLYPFVCTRIAVIRCPNGCFHNGDCVGATCFCYRGWTGRDCSQYHCNDIHNCSGNGRCVGPNVCKCSSGYLGRGCSYSYCSKFRTCSTCSKDPFCGWCDSAQRCMPGNAFGSSSDQCPDWFYYNCYTVGSVNHCSNQIQRVDCTNRQCNTSQEATNLESCQRCTDLEKCYNYVDDEKCRAWNATRCPNGLIQVDYTDPKRIANTILRNNVKVVDPNTTIIYSCPVLLPGQDDATSVFVAPRSLGIKVGDVISSAQAGGIMHKVNKTASVGPFIIIQGTLSKIEEAIQYADFIQEVSPVKLVDDTTLDEEPNFENLHGLLNGSIKLNSSADLHVFTAETSVYKCVGHIYKVDDALVSSQFLVINKTHALDVKPGDVVISNQSHGFIEKVVRVNQTSGMVFLETELQRCTQNTTWTKRLKSRTPDSSSDDDLVCTGGDNSHGLIITEPDPDQEQVSVNDSILGRTSHPVLAKVVESHVSGDFLLIEVLPVLSVVNGSAVAIATLDQLPQEHRRHKRAVETMKVEKTKEFLDNTIKLKGSTSITVKQTFEVDPKFTVSLTEVKDKDEDGLFFTKYSSFGVEMGSTLTYDVSVHVEIKASVSFEESFDILRPKQLGPSFCLPIVICVPSAFFLKVEGHEKIQAKGKADLFLSSVSTINLAMGTGCSKSDGCRSTNSDFTFKQETGYRHTFETKVSSKTTLTPTLTLKVPSVPKILKKALKTTKETAKKLFSYVGKKPSASKETTSNLPAFGMSVVLPLNLKALFTPCSKMCASNMPAPHQLQISYGFSKVVGKVQFFFLKKKTTLVSLSKDLKSKGKQESVCIKCVKHVPVCDCNNDDDDDNDDDNDDDDNDDDNDSNNTNKDDNVNDDDKDISDEKNPKNYPCGKKPCCVVGRKGNQCTQPDVQPNSADCSGNGVPLATSDCGSRCFCSARWTGSSCETRRPWWNWGDPHLGTLDGIEYDYFGIGEFWGCKSVFNDFGIQFRYFAYQRASLTGGVAIKAGRSVLSIMTVNTSDSKEFPKLRLDGRLVNISAYAGKKMKLSNRTVVIDFQTTFDSKADEASVILLSLQFESGLTITADVSHSPTMGRQYMNVLFTPTVAFKGHTEGLCGVMDNDPSNDLRGPNGEQYNDPIQFADSWRVTAVHNGSGLPGTWSWNSSNFHRDDIMDFSYNDPNHDPLYSLNGIDDAIVAKATAACSSLGLSDAMLQSCIYDVAVTNDTSLAGQESLKQSCPNQCSGKGRCLNSTCQCMVGWSGDSCQFGNCTDCNTEHGKCVKGFCECSDGWEGVTCDQKATCNNVNNCTSPRNGICWRTDQCRCHDGYIGRDCSIAPTCSNVSDCSGRGICVDYDVCKCQKDWTGKDCTQFSCGSLDYCSKRGRCVALLKCDCHPGWTGVSCALPDCAGVNQCSGQGVCVSSNTCKCYPGFQGTNCSDVPDCVFLGNCSGNGVCMLGENDRNVSCRCYSGFSGANCSIPSCRSINNCSGHGVCVEANLCKCDVGYTGADCSNTSCEGVNYCSGHGVCTSYDTCACDASWHGAACSDADCSSVNDCSKKGDCILPNTCECYPGYDGAACNVTAKQNLHAPIFAALLYNASVLENSPLGTTILQVQASDADTGRNGKLFFAIDNSNDASMAFTIDSISGDILTSLALDYESSSPKLFKLKIVASDDGAPRKSSFAFVYIKVVDVNDHCPIFHSPQTTRFNISQHTLMGTLLTVVSASDEDSGLNGEVKYRLSHSRNGGGAFKVDEQNGELTVAEGLLAEVYRLDVVAHDLGNVSCSRRLDVTVNVYAEPETKTTTLARTEAKPSSPSTITTANTKEIPVEAPTKSWYLHPLAIFGMSVGGFIVIVVAIIILLVIVSRKLKRKVKPIDEDPVNGSVDNPILVEDSEEKQAGIVSHGIKTTEAFEMKSMPCVD